MGGSVQAQSTKLPTIILGNVPYALVVGGIAILFGSLRVGLIPDSSYLSDVLLYIPGLSALFLILKFYGKSLPSEPTAS